MTVKGSWKLEDAKARFSEVVRQANSAGPQRVTVRGRQAAVIVGVAEFERLQAAKPQPTLVDFMEGLSLHTLDLVRDDDRGREAAL